MFSVWLCLVQRTCHCDRRARTSGAFLLHARDCHCVQHFLGCCPCLDLVTRRPCAVGHDAGRDVRVGASDSSIYARMACQRLDNCGLPGRGRPATRQSCSAVRTIAIFRATPSDDVTAKKRSPVKDATTLVGPQGESRLLRIHWRRTAPRRASTFRRTLLAIGARQLLPSEIARVGARQSRLEGAVAPRISGLGGVLLGPRAFF